MAERQGNTLLARQSGTTPNASSTNPERCEFMPHKVLILDNNKYLAEGIKASVESVDRDTEPIKPVHTVDDAKAQIEGHISEFLYALVDLDMGNVSLAHQGEAFLEWLYERGDLQGIEVLVFSSYADRINRLPHSIARHVQIIKRTASDAKLDLQIRQFVSETLRKSAKSARSQ